MHIKKHCQASKRILAQLCSTILHSRQWTLAYLQCCGSVSFWYGSGSGSDDYGSDRIRILAESWQKFKVSKFLSFFLKENFCGFPLSIKQERVSSLKDRLVVVLLFIKCWKFWFGMTLDQFGNFGLGCLLSREIS